MPNLPVEFKERMQKQLDGEWEAYERSLSQPSPVSIRINSFKIKNNTDFQQVKWSKAGNYLPERPLFPIDPFWHAGWYYVQEASSMFVEKALEEVQKNINPKIVLDLCAAPGGKTTHLTSLLPESLVVGNEVIRSRVKILNENIQKWGMGNNVVCCNDPSDFKDLKHFFDLVLVDAPCSGEGLFRKDPEAMKEWSLANVQLCAERQKRILCNVWESLKPGGFLIYSTCTHNRNENEEIVQWLRNQFNAASVPIEEISHSKEITISDEIGYRFYPHKTKGEGFFLALLRKPEEPLFTSKKSKKRKRIDKPKKEESFLNTWISNNTGEILIKNYDGFYAFPDVYLEELEFLSNRLNIVSAGQKIAEIKGNSIYPAHELALYQHINPLIFPSYELQDEEVLDYLAKQSVFLKSMEKGLVLVRYAGASLGWVKHLGNRTNNLYPKAWRLHKNPSEVFSQFLEQKKWFNLAP